MKITKVIIKEFEQTQKQFGTEVAIHDLIWNLAFSLFRDIGVRGIRTIYFKKKKPIVKKGAKT